MGDANADGQIDLTDLSTILNNFGATTSAWTSGNFDGAATIDLTDLSDVLNNFGVTYANATDGSPHRWPPQSPSPPPSPSRCWPQFHCSNVNARMMVQTNSEML